MDPDSKPIDALEREDYFDLFMRWIMSKDWTADSGLGSFYAFHAEKLARYMRECLDGDRNAGGLRRSGEREIDRAFLAWWLYAHANGGPHTSPP